MRKYIPNLLLISELILALAFVYLSTVLPTPPSMFSLQTGELFISLILYLCFGLNIFLLLKRVSLNNLTRICFSVGILSLALMLGTQVSHPVFAIREKAQAGTKSEANAVDLGIKLGEEVKQQNITAEEAKKQIEQEFKSEEPKTIAAQAVELSAQGKSNDEIKQTLAPTIPLKFGEWTCESIGCSYADETFTWTISTRSRLIGLAFVSASLGLLVFILNKDLVLSNRKLRG
jgi:hypothetical protein